MTYNVYTLGIHHINKDCVVLQKFLENDTRTLNKFAEQIKQGDFECKECTHEPLD